MKNLRELGWFRVAAAVPPVRAGAVRANVDEMLALARDAAAEGVELLVFPELCVTGYTCADLFHQETLLDAADTELARFLKGTAKLEMLILAGAPVTAGGLLYNAAVVCQGGKILGVVPKSFLPNAREFYEQRWFASGAEIADAAVVVAGQEVPFGTDLLFSADSAGGPVVGVELCEDLWSPQPPSTRQALAGASVICNLSASNELVGKAPYRRALVAQQSARCLAGYVYASAGVGESSTDLVFGGHCLIAENGRTLAESARFETDPTLTVADLDVMFLRHERRQSQTFVKAAELARRQAGASAFTEIVFDAAPVPAGPPRRTPVRLPFVPTDSAERGERCAEIFAIQSSGLATRLRHCGAKNAVIGLSGGLDSTLALLVTVEAFERAGLKRDGILGVTMPGFGTTERTLGNVKKLAKQLGVRLETIDIRAACAQHLKDLGHDGVTGDVTYENSQARERTQLLMDKANQTGGLVVGTGDLSELALGWCTYNGDHMSMYGVNAGVPKTLVKYLIQWVASHKETPAAAAVLEDILDTPISPELLPPDARGRIAQKTEGVLGPYELHDFFLYEMVRRGSPPEKILALAVQAFGAAAENAETGNSKLGRRKAAASSVRARPCSSMNVRVAGQVSTYAEPFIRDCLKRFLTRFFAHQFKRSCLPDGPKVGSICLSPRGDWRMPSDASAAEWLRRLNG